MLFLIAAWTLVLTLFWNSLIGIGHRNFGLFQELCLFVSSIALFVFAARLFRIAISGSGAR
jgi:hypothetical protein